MQIGIVGILAIVVILVVLLLVFNKNKGEKQKTDPETDPNVKKGIHQLSKTINQNQLALQNSK